MKYIYQYISLLKKINSQVAPRDYDTTEINDNDFLAMTELIQSGNIDGETEQGNVPGTFKKKLINVKPTLNGKLLQDKLEQEIASKTIIGRLKAAVPHFISIIIGIIIGVTVGIVNRWLFDQYSAVSYTINNIP